MTIQHRVALITGASVGFGKAIARRLAAESFHLILLARRRERLDALAAELSSRISCHIIACDVRDHEAVRKEVASLPSEFQEVDVLVNNAGLALGLEPAHKTRWEEWQEMIETNCTALAFITHLLLPGMVERNRGHIVNLGSTAASYAYPGGNVYGATKAFVEQFSRNLKADLVGTALRVTDIEPGLVGGSEFSLVRFRGDAQKADQVYAGTQPLTPEDVAEAVRWAITLPAHVNINRIEMMPVCQAPGPFAIHRKPVGQTT